MNLLQSNYTSKNWAECQKLLTQAMIQLATAQLDRQVQSQAQVVYEIGAFTSVAVKDQAAFERYIALLFPLYFDQTKALESAKNANAYVLLGLYLLSLLVRNQIAEFHVLLERINSAPGIDINNVYIQFPIQLQQCLVEGTYHRVVLARQQVPSPDYAWFIDALVDTIRNDLASCIEKSFHSIDMTSAARLLLLTPEQVPQLTKFAEQVLRFSDIVSVY